MRKTWIAKYTKTDLGKNEVTGNFYTKQEMETAVSKRSDCKKVLFVSEIGI